MLFHFNQYSSLLLPSFVHGVLFFLILWWRSYRDERLADRLLGLILLVFTLQVASWMLGFAGWYDEHDWHTSFMFYFLFNHWLAVGPLLYFYLLAVTNSQFSWKKHYWWHFLPETIWLLRAGSIFLFDVVIEHWINGNAFPYFYETHGNWFENGWGPIDKIWMFLEPLSVISYIILTLRLFRQYQSYIVQQFSDTGSIHFKWLRNILIAMIIGYLIWTSFDLMDYYSEQGLSYVQDWYSFFFLGILIYYLSIAGFAKGTLDRPQLALHFQPEQSNTVKQNDQSQNEMTAWKSKLVVLMMNEKPFLQPDLSLSDLAAKVNIPSATLSKVINTGFGKNFNEFINTYRVQEVQSKLSDPDLQHLTVLGIAIDSGFSSKATFNRVFKKLTGTSPSEYLRSLK